MKLPKSFDLSFLKDVDRKVIVLTIAVFIAVFSGGIFGDMVRSREINFTYALINAFFISLSLGAVITITQTRGKDSEKKHYRDREDKVRKKKK